MPEHCVTCAVEDKRSFLDAVQAGSSGRAVAQSFRRDVQGTTTVQFLVSDLRRDGIEPCRLHNFAVKHMLAEVI